MNVRIVRQQGHRFFQIGSEAFEPLAFRSFRPTPANVSLFHRAGVRLYQMQISGCINALGVPYSTYGGVWKDDETYDFTAFDEQMKMFRRFAPDGYFMIMILLDTPEWWLKKYPDDLNSYQYIGEACFNERWIAAAEKYLRAVIRYAEERYGDRIFAYSCSAGLATEWFDNTSFYPPSGPKTEGFRAWLHDAQAQPPTRDEAMDHSNPVLRGPDDPVASYYRYCCTLVPALIARFAAAAQREIQHQKLFGIFYGYTDCPNGGFQCRTATNGYEKVWMDKNIDMLFSPSAYDECRALDGASSYQYQVDSIALNDKLYLHEIDYRTHLAEYPRENGVIMRPCSSSEFETAAVLRRELCAALEKDAALWWFDFLGGYYASPALEMEIARQIKIAERMGHIERASVAEIAVFVDPMSFNLMKEESGLTMASVRRNRNSLHACGAPFDYYNLNDFSRIPLAQYKMLVFLNPVSIPENVLTQIHNAPASQLRVWVHAPHYAANGTCQRQNVEEAVQMRLSSVTGDRSGKILYKDTAFGFDRPIEPLYCVSDPEARPIALFDSGETAVARKENNVYIACGNVCRELWHDLAQSAQVHLYCDIPGAFYADSRFVAFQTTHSTACSIQMPFDCELEELFDGGIYHTEHQVLRYQAALGSTKLFLIRKR